MYGTSGSYSVSMVSGLLYFLFACCFLCVSLGVCVLLVVCLLLCIWGGSAGGAGVSVVVCCVPELLLGMSSCLRLYIFSSTVIYPFIFIFHRFLYPFLGFSA